MGKRDFTTSTIETSHAGHSGRNFPARRRHAVTNDSGQMLAAPLLIARFFEPEI
jgi:hypothetical protein